MNETRTWYLFHCDARVKLLCLVAYIVVTLHAHTLGAFAACGIGAAAMAAATRLTPRAAIAAIRPLAAILVITAVMQVLYLQQGEVLVRIGAVAVTQGALFAAAAMVVSLTCIMVASVAFMRCTPVDQLVSTFDWMLGPLRAIGVRTGSFVLALSVALRFVPVLVDEYSQVKRAHRARRATFEGSLRTRLAAYTRLFPPLVRSCFRRADRLADSFVSRCFTGEVRTTLHTRRLSFRDALILLATAAIVAAGFAL